MLYLPWPPVAREIKLSGYHFSGTRGSGRMIALPGKAESTFVAFSAARVRKWPELCTLPPSMWARVHSWSCCLRWQRDVPGKPSASGWQAGTERERHKWDFLLIHRNLERLLQTWRDHKLSIATGECYRNTFPFARKSVIWRTANYIQYYNDYTKKCVKKHLPMKVIMLFL